MEYAALFLGSDELKSDSLERAFIDEPFEVRVELSAQDAMEILKTGTVGVVICDEKSNSTEGIEFLNMVRKKYPNILGILLTGENGLESAVKAVGEGEIFRFLLKPFNEADLANTIRQALYQRDLIAENRRLLRISKKQFDIIKMLGKETSGIFDLQKSETGSIILDDPGNLNDLLKNLSEELHLSEKRTKRLY
jgi:two-component system probable response regulator PhcQ